MNGLYDYMAFFKFIFQVLLSPDTYVSNWIFPIKNFHLKSIDNYNDSSQCRTILFPIKKKKQNIHVEVCTFYFDNNIYL